MSLEALLGVPGGLSVAPQNKAGEQAGYDVAGWRSQDAAPRTLGAKPVRREGEREGRWVLLDFIDIIVHVQHAEERVYYSLERIWKDCPTVELPEEIRRGRTRLSGDRRDDVSGAAS